MNALTPRPVAAPALKSAATRLDEARRGLLAAFSGFLDARPSPEEIGAEIDATGNALKALADLRRG